jgi:hypothetical protein
MAEVLRLVISVLVLLSSPFLNDTVSLSYERSDIVLSWGRWDLPVLKWPLYVQELKRRSSSCIRVLFEYAIIVLRNF